MFRLCSEYLAQKLVCSESLDFVVFRQVLVFYPEPAAVYNRTEEQNIMEEMINFENYQFQENDTGIELAERQFSKILENLTQHSCKLVKFFKKNKNSKQKPWVDRELSDLKKTVIQLGSALKKQPFNLQLKNNSLKYSGVKNLYKEKEINTGKNYLIN
jgi:hypothetical protein